MLRDGDFALEVTVYETNTPPHFRLYAYRNDKPLAPGEVKATIQLKRLDGEVNNFSFIPEKDYLVGSGEWSSRIPLMSKPMRWWVERTTPGLTPPMKGAPR